MKSLIVYYSNYNQNTEKIAKVFAKKINADLMNIKETKEINIDKYNLIGFGSGVYKENLSPKIFKIAEKLSLTDKNIFVFSTSGIGAKFYNKKLIKLLRSKGGLCKGSFACKGSFDNKSLCNIRIFNILSKFAAGHPNESDVNKAEEFINKVVQMDHKI